GSTSVNKLDGWNIDEYTVIYSNKKGPFGPSYNEYDVYKKGKYLSYAAYIMNGDSCNLLFRERNDYFLVFDLCNKKKKILSEKKRKLSVKEIDSISIRPYDSIRITAHVGYAGLIYDTIVSHHFDSSITRKLGRSATRNFCARWDHALSHGYNRLGKGYYYLVT